jgi:hypothetical protein
MIDVDDIRHLVVAGHAAPWEGEEGRRQQQIGVENACDLARRFHQRQIEVVLADFVTTTTAAIYRRHLHDLRVIRLQLPFTEARQRVRLRPAHLTDQEFEDLYELDASSDFHVDHIIDVAGLDPNQQADAVNTLWSGS